MAVGAEVDDGRLFCQQNAVGRMGVMARGAISVPDRFMFGNGSLLAFDRIHVASAAEGYHRFLEEPFFFRGMGIVTAKAPLFG
jgi:hypothetical protein